MADTQKFRDRKFCAVLYPEDETHVAAIEKLKSGGYNFAAILHDKDVYEDGEHKGETKKPHWHVVVRFKNAVWNTAIAKELGIQPNYLEACANVDTASFSPSIDTDYETWIKTGIWIVLPDESETGGSGDDGGNDNDNGEDKPLWLPLRPGTDVEEAGQLTQDEVQSGTGYIGTEYETDASVGVDHDDYFDYPGKKVEYPDLEFTAPPAFENPSIASILTFLQWFWEQLCTLLKWIGECIKLLPQQVYYDLQYCLQWLVNAITAVLNRLSEILKPLMDYLLEGIKKIFIPSEDFLTVKVQSLRTKFDWIDPFIVFAENISGELFSTEPPVIYIHLDDAEGSYNYGGTIPFLDMRWYARYKEQGDLILSGFLWALFAWRMYLKLPGIISGASGTIGHISSYSRKDDD